MVSLAKTTSFLKVGETTMANKIFRVLVLAVLVVSVLCFVGCKDEAVVETNSDLSNVIDSADPDRDQTNSNDNVTSGIELEEDVFDDDDISSTTSSSNTQFGSSTNSSSDKNNPSSNQSTSDNSTNNSSENSSGDQEENNSSENASIIEEDDGKVKLPVDWF